MRAVDLLVMLALLKCRPGFDMRQSGGGGEICKARQNPDKENVVKESRQRKEEEGDFSLIRRNETLAEERLADFDLTLCLTK